RAAHALLEARVLEAVQLVAAAEAWVDRRLLLGGLNRHRVVDDATQRRAQAARRLGERAPGAAPGPGRGRALDLDHVLARMPRRDREQCRGGRRSGAGLGGVVGHQCVATTTIAVTSALRVARGSSTFQPKLISWS